MSVIFERGQVYPLFAFFLIPLIAVSALSVDIGYYRYEQRVQQTAADSAAITGALQSLSTSSSSTITSSAQTDASSNGFTDGTNTVTVTVSPTYVDSFTSNGSGGLTGTTASGVKVTITKNYNRFFGGVFSSMAQQSISTSAVAILKAATNATPCITGLGSAPALTTGNGVKLVAPNCGIAINGNMTCNGGQITVASWAVNAAANASSCSSNNYTPSSPAPSGAVVDPCNNYVGCAYIKNNIDGRSPDNNCGATSGATVTGSVTSSFALGSFTCFNNADLKSVSFGPGVYVLKNGAFFEGANVGTGVVFYIDDDTNSTIKASNADVIDVSTSNASLQFAAPTSTTTGGGSNFQGVLFYQNPAGLSAIQPGCKGGGGTALNCFELDATVQGSSCPPGISGIWYLPHAAFNFNGQNGDCLTANLIFNNATFNGQGKQISMFPPSSTSAGQNLYVAYLVE